MDICIFFDEFILCRAGYIAAWHPGCLLSLFSKQDNLRLAHFFHGTWDVFSKRSRDFAGWCVRTVFDVFRGVVFGLCQSLGPLFGKVKTFDKNLLREN